MEFTKAVLDLPLVKEIAHYPLEHFLLIFKCSDKNLTAFTVSNNDACFVETPSVPEILQWLQCRNIRNPQAVIVHNHPANYFFACLPSDYDLIHSELLRWQLAAVGIELVDSIIVTSKKYWSFKEHGLLQSEKVFCSGEDILAFINGSLIQMSTVLPQQSKEIENFCSDLENVRREFVSASRQPWYKKWLATPPPCVFPLATQSDCYLEMIAASIRVLDLNGSHPVYFEKVLSFGRNLQENLFRNLYVPTA